MILSDCRIDFKHKKNISSLYIYIYMYASISKLDIGEFLNLVSVRINTLATVNTFSNDQQNC